MAKYIWHIGSIHRMANAFNRQKTLNVKERILHRRDRQKAEEQSQPQVRPRIKWTLTGLTQQASTLLKRPTGRQGRCTVARLLSGLTLEGKVGYSLLQYIQSRNLPYSSIHLRHSTACHKILLLPSVFISFWPSVHPHFFFSFLLYFLLSFLSPAVEYN